MKMDTSHTGHDGGEWDTTGKILTKEAPKRNASKCLKRNFMIKHSMSMAISICDSFSNSTVRIQSD